VNENDELVARYAELRMEQERQAPEYGAIVRRAKSPPRVSRLRLGLAAGAMAIVCIIIVSRFAQLPVNGSAPQIDAMHGATLVAAWKSPTDFLLDTPQQALMRSVPGIGDSAIPANFLAPPDTGGGANSNLIKEKTS
jgi:hypothetical protein